MPCLIYQTSRYTLYRAGGWQTAPEGRVCAARMVRLIEITVLDDLKQFMKLASESISDIGVHTEDGQIADAKSILGLMAINYNKPIKVVTEDEKFLKKLDKWAVDMDYYDPAEFNKK